MGVFEPDVKVKSLENILRLNTLIDFKGWIYYTVLLYIMLIFRQCKYVKIQTHFKNKIFMFYFNIDKMLRNGKFAYRAEEGGGDGTKNKEETQNLRKKMWHL